MKYWIIFWFFCLFLSYLTHRFENTFLGFWRGELRLVVSFWLFFFLMGNVLDRLFRFILTSTESTLLVFVLATLTPIYLFVGVWRSATQYTIVNPKKWWGTITKCYVVILLLWHLFFPILLLLIKTLELLQK